LTLKHIQFGFLDGLGTFVHINQSIPNFLCILKTTNFVEFFGACRGIVTADVLLQGLNRGAIATRKLKGVNRDKGYERFILVRPLTMKVRPTSSWVGIAEVSMTRERDTLCLALDLLSFFSLLSRRRVVPLYTRVDALRPTESRPAHRQCPAR
jgi:hypothetical protein